MLFADFNKMKVVKEYNTITLDFNLPLEINIHTSINQINQWLNDKIAPQLTGCGKNLGYTFIFSDDGGNNAVATDEDADFLVTLANLINNFVFNYFITDVKRHREHRLDVPQKLKGLNCPYSIIKKAVNFDMKCERFNVIINYKDLTYKLVDVQKFLEEEQEFKHSVDELEEGEAHDN